LADTAVIEPRDLSGKPTVWYGGSYEVPQYYGDESPKNILYYGRERVHVRVDRASELSKPFGIVSGNNAELVCLGKDDTRFVFTVNVRAGPDKFWRSRIVRIFPKHILVNLAKSTPLLLLVVPELRLSHSLSSM
jgi:SHR-binding domain of vacuolar-sorting associated protein 13